MISVCHMSNVFNVLIVEYLSSVSYVEYVFSVSFVK
jgi:hypothetical protein